jgi:hypothetical protein
MVMGKPLRKNMGRIVSRKLLTDESVCIACGKPISDDHMGLQTARSLTSAESATRVASGLLHPNWKEYQMRAVKRLLRGGMSCQTVIAMYFSDRIPVKGFGGTRH